MVCNPIEGVAECFEDIEDPRVEGRCAHRLTAIMGVALCAIISGADNWVEVEQYGQAKEGWLRTFLELPHGIPSHDTFGRVFARIEPTQFREGFLAWVRQLYARLVGTEEAIAIDGKTLRRSYDGNQDPLHLVSAWATRCRLVLGQIATEDKSNEITAIPHLLDMLDLTDCVVTIDAMGCQRAIAKQIVEQGGDYLLQVKGNQPILHDRLQNLFVGLQEGAEPQEEVEVAHSVDKGHGRIETRYGWVVTDEDWLRYLQRDPHRERWHGLRSVIRVRRRRRIDSQVSEEDTYYISSLSGDAQRILALVRGHWGIENGLHWVLDIAFREDESRVRVGQGAENLALLRHLATNLLKQETTAKIGIHAKRMRCAWDHRYLRKVLSV